MYDFFIFLFLCFFVVAFTCDLEVFFKLWTLLSFVKFFVDFIENFENDASTHIDENIIANLI